MSKRTIAVLIVCVVLAASISAASAQSEGQTSTSIIVQNLSTSEATVMVEFYPTTGVPSSGAAHATLPGESSATFDQRYSSGDPGLDPFQGSVVVSASEPIGAVVQEMRSGGSAGVKSYEAYNAPGIAQEVTAPLILRGISSAGKTWNTFMAIQNTDVSDSADVTVTFTPAGLGSATTVNDTIPAGGSLYLMQKDQSALGSQFFGSAKIECTNGKDVAVAVNSASTGGAVLIAYPTYVAGSTEVSLPGAMKNIASKGDNYFTSMTIVNMGAPGDPDPIVEIEYQPNTGTATGPYSVTVSTATTIDQRYDTHITSDSFFGAVKLTSTNATPIAAVLNTRGDAPGGGARFATTYSGFADGVQTAYLPYLLKYIGSAGYGWSASILLQNLDPASGDLEVDVMYKEDPSIGTHTYTSHQSIATFDWVDLRYDPNLAQATFYGGAKIVSTNGRPFGAVVLVRGGGGTGDALSSYLAISE